MTTSSLLSLRAVSPLRAQQGRRRINLQHSLYFTRRAEIASATFGSAPNARQRTRRGEGREAPQ
jgi:hypothetical protein